MPANDEGLPLFLYPPKIIRAFTENGYNSRTQFKSLTSEQTLKVYKDMLDGKHEGFSKYNFTETRFIYFGKINNKGI